MQGAGAAASTLGDLRKLRGPFGQCAAEFIGVAADLGRDDDADRILLVGGL
jgi:hypothetical protein